ncbi:sugar-binding transcriptional regulator [Ornatilinea apprima]|uniref:sugar-binding transcriptional regulator n=1 Tax=Ornatilinea apprima TaxID=1134406 RepID=UPI001364ABDB|nr:sugar-binding transcriptional regulator [Ornatilinea apprima]
MEDFRDYEYARLISSVLTLYYFESLSQYQIAEQLGLSTAKVNRLLKQARQQGMVEIVLRTPFQTIFNLEQQFQSITGIKKAIIVPCLTENPEATTQLIGRAAANFLMEQIRDGDTICLGGGNGVRSVVQNITGRKIFDNITVVPALGGVQGRYETDVNNLAADLAQRLGAASYAFHAPAITDCAEERENLIQLRQVKEVLDIARGAQIALYGIGAVRPETASFFRFTSLREDEVKDLIADPNNTGEILAHILDPQGNVATPAFEQRVVGLGLPELDRIPLTIGIATSEEKVLPVVAAIRGGHVKALVTDEKTARAVIDLYQQS